MSKYCPNCNTLLNDDDIYCRICGTKCGEVQNDNQYSSAFQQEENSKKQIDKTKIKLILAIISVAIIFILITMFIIVPMFMRNFENMEKTQNKILPKFFVSEKV